MTNGIPLTLQQAEEWAATRISEKRLKHVRGVVSVADELARKHGCDVFQAKIAAWLHDACKEVKDKELILRAIELGVPVDAHQRAHGHLLHGPVAAATVKQELGIVNEDVLAAISEHTLGNVPMCPLSEVVYLADCLEESRPADFRRPILDALNGECLNMNAGLVAAMDLCIQHLLETRRPIHPLSVEVRNHYLERTINRAG